MFTCGLCRVNNCTKVCIKCRARYYCSKECQIKEWPEHKKYCGKAANFIKTISALQNTLESLVIAYSNDKIIYKCVGDNNPSLPLDTFKLAFNEVATIKAKSIDYINLMDNINNKFIIGNSHFAIFAQTIEGNNIAFCSFQINWAESILVINNLYVLPDYQRKLIGTTLYRIAEDFMSYFINSKTSILKHLNTIKTTQLWTPLESYNFWKERGFKPKDEMTDCMNKNNAKTYYHMIKM